MASLQRALISDIRNTNAWNERIDGIGSFLFVKERLALELFTKSVDDGEQVAERKVGIRNTKRFLRRSFTTPSMHKVCMRRIHSCIFPCYSS